MLDISYRKKEISVYVPKLVRQWENGEHVTYRRPFAGQGCNRSVLLVDVPGKKVYYWGKKQITHAEITLVNIRKQPKNCDGDWGSIELEKYFDTNRFLSFHNGQNYFLQNCGAWHVIRNRLSRVFHLQSESRRLQKAKEYKIYDHDRMVDRGRIKNCKCDRCNERGII